MKRVISIFLILILTLTIIPGSVVDAAEGSRKSSGKIAITSVSKISATGVKLKWTSVKNADGYEVYVKSGKQGFQLVKAADSKETIINKLPKNKKLSLKVRSFSIKKGTMHYGKFSTVKLFDMKLPTDVELTSVRQTSDGKSELKWKKVKGVAGYQIYRKAKETDKFQKIATVKGAAKTSFVDTEAAYEHTYFYAVKAFKGKKVSANYSNEKSIGITYQDSKDNYAFAGLDAGKLYCSVKGTTVDVKETALFKVYYETKPASEVLLFQDNHQLATMNDQGENGDEVAGDGIYSCYAEIAAAKQTTYQFYAQNGSKKSDVVEVRVYEKLTEQEVAKTKENASQIIAAADAYTDADGYVKEEQSKDALNAVYQSALGLKEKGTISNVFFEDSNVTFVFDNGLTYIYQPNMEGKDAVGSDVDVTVMSMQPWKTGYIVVRGKYTADLDDKCTDGASQLIADKFKNYHWSYNLDDDAVTLDAVKKFGKNQVILWHGHGGYGSYQGSFIWLGEQYDEKYYDDWIAGRIVVSTDGTIGFTSAFVEQYIGAMDNSFIYLACCSSGQDSRLADSFLAKGASAVVGNDESIVTTYNCKLERSVVDYLVSVDENSKLYHTLGQGLTYAKTLHGEDDGSKEHAKALIFGDGNYRLSDDCTAKIEFDQDAIKLSEGNSVVLSAKTDGDVSTLKWSCANPEIVSVEAFGEKATIKALKDGTTTITCSIGNVSAKCKVVVESDLILEESISGKEGEKYYLFAMTGAPSVIWSSDNEKVVSVKKFTNRIGEVSFVGAGTAKITCKAGNTKMICKVTVMGDTLSLDRTTLTIQKGKTAVLTATTTNPNVTWTSSAPSVVSVEPKGTKQAALTAKREGTVTITCRAGTKVATCKVIVKSATVGTKLELNKTEAVIRVGETVTVKAITNFDSIKWSTSGTGKATITEKNGNVLEVTGKKSGTVVIECTAGSKKEKCYISIVDPLEDGFYTTVHTGKYSQTAKTVWGETYPAFSSSYIYSVFRFVTLYGAYAPTDEYAFGAIGAVVKRDTYNFEIARNLEIYSVTVDSSNDDSDGDDDAEWDDWEESDGWEDLEEVSDEEEETDDEVEGKLVVTKQNKNYFKKYFSLLGSEYDSYVREREYYRGLTFEVKNGVVVKIYCWEF